MDKYLFPENMGRHYANNIPYLDDLEPELINSWLEINLSDLRSNITYLKSLLNSNTKMMSVVKADAYGHGLIEIAHEAEKSLLINYLGVANIAEAKLLKQSGINLPIIVLGTVFSHQLEVALKYEIETVINSIQNVLDIESTAKRLNIKARVHLKIDSGMGRVGVRPENLDSLLHILKSCSNINLVGVMTHFAESEKKESDFTNYQNDVFKKCLEKINSDGFNNFLVHSANSSATLIHSNTYFDMTRQGLAMYGIGDPPNNNLKPILSLKSKVINIKEFPENHSLGYGRSFFTKRKSIIGIIPIGYADGFPRILSNNQDVLINGKRYPVVGNISMDQSLIDLTDCYDIKIGQEVILIGKSDNEKITVEEWAKKSYKISYEVICGFGNRLPRIYV